MQIQEVVVEGLRVAGRVALADDPHPGGISGAVCLDALRLVRASWAPSAAALAALGLDGTPHLVDGMMDEVSELRPAEVELLVAPAEVRHVTVTVTFSPDPLQFRLLRDHAVKDAELTRALGETGTIVARAGWLFNRAGTHASVSPTTLQIGSYHPIVVGAERPPWVPALLRGVGARVLVIDPSPAQDDALASTMHVATTSFVASQRLAAQAAAAALGELPDGPGRPHVVRVGERPLLCFGDDLRPMRTLDPRRRLVTHAVLRAFVDAPDVLAIPHAFTADDPWFQWLTRRFLRDDAPIEQLVLVGA